jgi:MFS family permease
MLQSATSKSISRWRWFAFSVLSLFYAYEFFLRISPSILIDQLLQQYRISALGIAGFSSSYFIGYLLMQIPAGLLFDRLGIKKVAIISLLVCVAGGLIFTLEHNYFLGIISRFILGCGSAFAFIGALAFIRRHYLERYFALLVAIVISVGTISGAFGQVFAVEIINYLSWHLTIGGMAAWGCVLATALACVPSKYFADGGMQQPQGLTMTVSQELRIIIKNRLVWVNAMIGGILYVPTSVLATTWGIEFFHKAFHLSDAVGSFGVTVLFIGCAIGGPVSGFLASAWGREKLMLSLSAILAALVLVALLMQKNITPSGLYGFLLVFGFFSGAQVVIWRIFTRLVPDKQLTGSASALTNLIIMLLVAIGDLCVGKLISFINTGMQSHAGGLSAGDLRAGLYFLPILLMTAPPLLMLLARMQKLSCNHHKNTR